MLAKHHGGHQADIQRQGVLLLAVARGQAVFARQIDMAGLQATHVQFQHHQQNIRQTGMACRFRIAKTSIVLLYSSSFVIVSGFRCVVRW